MRGDVGGHAHRDARAAVAQQVGEPAREDGGLGARLVVVLNEIDRILVDIGQHLRPEDRHPRLRVPHGGRGVAVHGAEVAVPVHERVAHVPVLRQARQRRVDDLLAVGVVVAGGVAGDLGALAVLRPGGEVEVVHRVEDAALGRLQPVAHVRQRARDDDAHGERHERLAHLLFDVDVGYVDDFFWFCHSVRRLQCGAQASLALTEEASEVSARESGTEQGSSFARTRSGQACPTPADVALSSATRRRGRGRGPLSRT